MADWQFWLVAVTLATCVALILMRALRQPLATGTPSNPDLAVYKDQLTEIDRDLTRGTISPEEAQRLRAEIGRRVLEADRLHQTPVARATATPNRTALALVLILALPGTAALYWTLGAPGYPDMALEPRLAGLDAGIANRPTQEAQLLAQGHPRDQGLDTTLGAELAGITGPDALRDAFRTRLEAGEAQAAVRTQERLLTVLGTGATATDHANLALALVVEAEGYVSPEAEANLRETLSRDMSNELARYLVGEMFLQGGRYDQTFKFWRPIAETGNPDAPWVSAIRQEIEQVAELAGIRYSLPEAQREAQPDGQSGPSSDDLAAAAEMTPEERQAMIEGMVAQLSDRLATEGGDVEDWNRLIRSLAVLERLSDAQGIYDEAKLQFEGRPAELSFLRLAAVESGLNP